MKTPLSLLIFIISLFFVLISDAAILSGFRTNISFRVSADRVAVTWSESLEVRNDGLSFRTNSLTHGWIQTKQIPVGLAWRPPIGSAVTVKIDGNFPIDFDAGSRALSVFIRYGCDGIHWSTWIPMTYGYGAIGVNPLPSPTGNMTETNAPIFTAQLRIPRIQQERYLQRMDDWRNTDPEWCSDQDAYSRWLLEKDPFFFRDNLAVLGYVQVRLELDGLYLGQVVIRSVNVSGQWGIGGVHEVPKSGEYPLSHEQQWNLFQHELEDKNPNQF